MPETPHRAISSKQGLSDFKWTTGFAPFITSFTLVITAMLYLAGSGFEISLTGRFGLYPSILDRSLQDILMDGYNPLLFGTIALGICLIIYWFTTWFTWTWGSRKLTIFSKHTMKWLNLAVRGYMISAYLFLILTYASIAGAYYGHLHARLIADEVEHGCHRCFIYVVEGHGIPGVAIAQDRERLILYTQKGTLVLKNENLSAVLSQNKPSRDKPSKDSYFDRFYLFGGVLKTISD